MLHPKILILSNDLTRITTNSLKANMPTSDYKTVKCGGNPVETALNNTDDITIVVRGGVVFTPKKNDLPPKKTLQKYGICVSRKYVYIDNDRMRPQYTNLQMSVDDKSIDFSVFIINPKKWKVAPHKDDNKLEGVKKLYMPRYMNHATDPVISEVISAADAFYYGVMGVKASIHNYVPNLLSGEATINESYAYHFDKVANYVKGLPLDKQEAIKNLGVKSQERIAKFRQEFADVNERYGVK